MNLQISEIFHSIQGEGLHTGRPTVFVRLAGCNLRCAWCDTQFAWSTKGAQPLSTSEVLQRVAGFGCKLVLVTGGEPLLQPRAVPLMLGLLAAGHEVLLETNGSVSIKDIPAAVGVALDIKCPGSGMEQHNCYDNIALLKPADIVKFIVASASDFGWAVGQIVQHRIYDFCHNIVFSAACPQMQPAELAEQILQLPRHWPGLSEAEAGRLLAAVRLQVQVHKVIWPGNERGR